MKLFLPLLIILVTASCNSVNGPEAGAVEVGKQQSGDPYAERIEAAEQRLGATPAGQSVLRAIQAHGGLQTWYENSPLYYHFNYQPTDPEKTIRDSYALNDYVNARAVHQSAEDRDVTYGFDGQDAWQNPAEAELAVSPRFWSLTPYYFVGLPFVLADEGINFSSLGQRSLDGTDYEVIQVTYQEGTGDADGDYYNLYLNPKTGRLAALNYIVSYPGFFEDGNHLPEKLMRITGFVDVEGITLPTGYRTSWSDAPDETITTITVSDYEFRPDTDPSAFDRPATAKIVSDLPNE